MLTLLSVTAEWKWKVLDSGKLDFGNPIWNLLKLNITSVLSMLLISTRIPFPLPLPLPLIFPFSHPRSSPNRFRNIAAGDILRSVYSQLSQDPNSLANLDQDLPNYTQNRVRVVFHLSFLCLLTFPFPF